MVKALQRSKRLRKKLYLDEYAVLGFAFSCKINIESESEYELFFESFADTIDSRNLFVSLDGKADKLEGFVSSGDRYGSATDEDRKAIKASLSAYSILSDVAIGDLVDACYED